MYDNNQNTALADINVTLLLFLLLLLSTWWRNIWQSKINWRIAVAEWPRRSVTERFAREMFFKLRRKEVGHERSSVKWFGRLFRATGAALRKARLVNVVRWLLRSRRFFLSLERSCLTGAQSWSYITYALKIYSALITERSQAHYKI